MLYAILSEDVARSLEKRMSARPIHASGYIRVSIGPVLSCFQAGKFSNDQATGKSGLSRCIAVYSRVRACARLMPVMPALKAAVDITM
jgi:hypothetical protein